MRAHLTPRIGTHVGPYRLEARLGGGHDTEVWRANGDGIVVALKLARHHSDDFAIARMAREVVALGRLDHPNIVEVFDAGESDGESFIATSLRDGATVAHFLNDGLVSCEVAAAILAPIAAALAHAHARGIVHRDLKPSNILLTSAGPVLIDFGAAAIDGVTLDGWVDGVAAVVATPQYCAPETAAIWDADLGNARWVPGGAALAISGALDVYSLASVFTEAVTGSTGGCVEDHLLAEFIAQCRDSNPSVRPTMESIADRFAALAVTATVPHVSLDRVHSDRDEISLIEPDTAIAVTSPTQRTGRELDLARLVDEFDAASASKEMRATLITAAPGAGKTWLLEAAAARMVACGATVLRASCSEAVGDTRVFAPWTRRIAMQHNIAELIGHHYAAVLLGATGVASGGAIGVADTATLAEAIGQLLAKVDHPVAIIDDLHHASSDVLEILGRLAFRSGVAGTLWLSARPGYVDADDLGVQTMILGALPDEVIVDLAGAEAAEIAGGNPLLAHEIMLARESGNPLSGTVQTLIAARLDRLPNSLGDDLATLATCGEVFWPETLQSTQSIGAMCRAGLIRLRVNSTVVGSTEAQWLHPMLREVAYSRIPDSVRGARHLEVARKLDGASVDVETVAHHAAIAFETGAQAPEFIANTAARAGRSALDRFALENANRWIHLLDASEAEPESGTADTLRAELLLREGKYERSAELADRHIDLAGELGGRALAVSAEAHLSHGDHEVAALRARDAVRRLKEGRLCDQATVIYVRAMSRGDDIELAATVCAEAIDRAVARDQIGNVIELRGLKAVVDANVAMRSGGDIPQAIVGARQALKILRESGDIRSLADAAYDIADVVAVVDPVSAIGLLDEAMNAARAIGNAALVGKLAHLVAMLSVDIGDADAVQANLVVAGQHAQDYQVALESEALRGAVALALRGPTRETLDRLARGAREAQDWLSDILHMNVAARVWFGHATDAESFLPLLHRHPIGTAVSRLSIAALRGATAPPIEAPTVAVANELALIAMLHERFDTANELLVQRHEFLVSTGSTYQRYNHYYPGALVAALGPQSTEPATEWLVDQILASPFPYMWAMHRAMCGLLLCERKHPRGDELRIAARSLVAISEPDIDVQLFLERRFTLLR